jgi:hypothetical protein
MALPLVSFVVADAIAIATLVRDTFHVRRNKDFELGLSGRLLSIACFCAVGIVLASFLGFLLLLTAWLTFIAGLFFIMLFTIPFVICATKLMRLGVRLGCLTAVAAMREDSRPPVLYLRSFDADTDLELLDMPARGGSLREQRIEERDTTALRRLGVVLALSRPGKRLPPLGATRVTFNDSEWRYEVQKLMEKCCLIVVQVGFSNGLLWEMNQAFKSQPFRPILICVSSHADSVINRQQQYERFRRVMSMQFPRISSSLPQDIGNTRYLLFLEPHNVLEFESQGARFPLELLEYIRRGTAAEPRQMSERTKRRLRFLAIAVLAAILGASLFIWITSSI